MYSLDKGLVPGVPQKEPKGLHMADDTVHPSTGWWAAKQWLAQKRQQVLKKVHDYEVNFKWLKECTNATNQNGIEKLRWSDLLSVSKELQKIKSFV